MKFYRLDFYNTHMIKIDSIFFPDGRDYKDLKEYFQENPFLYRINAYNKYNQDRYTYTEYRNGVCITWLYNKKGAAIYHKMYNGGIEYPLGKKVYDEYVNQLRKEKLEKILNKEVK